MISRYLTIPAQHSFFLFGPRLTGKTTWLKQHLPAGQLNLNLLRASIYEKYLKNPGLLRKEVEEGIKNASFKWCIIDEIQKIPELLDEVHSLLEEYPIHFALTGSSARKLKRGGANLLAGRAVELRLFPFIFNEVPQQFELENVLKFGLLPKVFLENDLSLKIRILNAYSSNYLKEEIQQEQVVRRIGPFAKFLELAAESNALELNFSGISKEIGLSSNTIREYFSILTDTLIGSWLFPWEKTVRKQLAGHPKFYFFDTGVVNALTQRLYGKIEKTTLGFLFETWLIHEIRAFCSYADLPYHFYYWKTKADTEVDLVIAYKNEIVLALEFKYKASLTKSDFSGLISFGEDYPNVRRIMVCDIDRPYQENGVELLPWKDFLSSFLNKFATQT